MHWKLLLIMVLLQTMHHFNLSIRLSWSYIDTAITIFSFIFSNSFLQINFIQSIFSAHTKVPNVWNQSNFYNCPSKENNQILIESNRKMASFVCVQCEWEFPSFDGCRAHINNVHDSDVSAVTVKVYLHQVKKYEQKIQITRKIMTRSKDRKAKIIALEKMKLMTFRFGKF